MTTRMKPIYLYAPITRVDDEKREITAYAFVNEVVEGEGGVRLKRAAMEAATPDYMQWANVREMHQAQAAGVASNVTWDEKGALMTLRVVDDAAWKKCKEGVYKGLSVGVHALMMRGKDVEKARWFETSLVDRPKDPDARFVALRAEGSEDEAEVEILDEEPAALERGAAASFAELVADREPQTLMYLAFDLLRSVLWRCRRAGGENVESTARESIQQFADYIAPLLTAAPSESEDLYYCEARASLERLLADETTPELLRGVLEELSREQVDALPEDAPLQRIVRLYRADDRAQIDTLSTTNQELVTRAEAAETELAEVRRSLTDAEERVRTLERQPAGSPPPVRYPQALNRTFQANGGTSVMEARQTLETELKRLQEELPKEPDPQKRSDGAARINVLRMQLATLGSE